MTEFEWYNSNAYRSFPLEHSAVLSNAALLPTAAIVDFGILFDLPAAFDPASHHVYLHGISNNGSSIVLTFKAGGSGAPSNDFTATFATSLANKTAVDLVGDNISGFVVIGDAAAIAAAVGVATVTVAQAHDAAAAKIEPSRVQTLWNAYLQSLAVYAKETTQWAPTPDSGGEEIIEIQSSIQGAILWEDGYNAEVLVDPLDNALTLRAAVGIGEGQMCNWPSVPGMPECGDLIATINAVQAGRGGVFTILGDRGIQVVADPLNPYTLTLQIGAVGNLYCSGSLSA
jgi:hypothetical protein